MDEPDLEPAPEARVLINGEPVAGGAALFAGSLPAARQFVTELSPAQQAEVSVWTPGHVFTVAELLAEPPGHEHDPQ